MFFALAPITTSSNMKSPLVRVFDLPEGLIKVGPPLALLWFHSQSLILRFPDQGQLRSTRVLVSIISIMRAVLALPAFLQVLLKHCEPQQPMPLNFTAHLRTHSGL